MIEALARATDPGPVDLAHEQPFLLGDLTVEPRSRELVAPDGARRTLEPRVMQVLVALARADGATVSREELIRTCWKGTVVGEDSINRTISLLRKAAEEMGGKTFRIETIPKLGYRLLVPESERGAIGGDSAPPDPEFAPARRLAWTALIVAALVATGIALSWRSAPTGPAYSVNVQPFRITGAARGFDEQLLSTLTSQNVPTAVGSTRLILTGSVEERDAAIRVDARLADSASGEVVWSGAIVRPTEPGGVARTAEIVGSIAQCTVAGANDDGGAIPLDILSRYARTCELGHRGQPRRGVMVARDLTRRAPEFAPGWFALSFHAATLYFSEPAEDPALRAEALAAADKLTELRPRAQDGYASKFLVTDPARMLERERLLLRATRLEPIYADVAQLYHAEFLSQVGRLEEAYQLRRAAAQQSPEAPGAHGAMFIAAAATGRWAVAEQALERVRHLNPAIVPGLLWRKAVWTSDWDEAERLMPVEHPAQQQATAAAYRALASGDPERREAAARLLRDLPADCCLRMRIELLAQLGRPGDAVALLSRFETGRVPATRGGPTFLWDPALRPLWYDAAIEPFLRRNGWIAYWRGTGVRPDVCGEPKPPSFCRLLKA